MIVYEIRKIAEITPDTIPRVRKDKDISLIVLGCICDCLECNFESVIEYIRDEETSKDGEDICD